MTPVTRDRDSRVIGIVSLHQLGAPRQWTDAEIAACREAAARLLELL